MFKRSNPKGTNSEWRLSAHHPSLDVNDTDPLPMNLGNIASLPPTYQLNVQLSFVQRLRDAAVDHRDGQLNWFNIKLPPNTRLRAFEEFIDQCEANEMVWVYSRFREVIFSMLYKTFVSEVSHLNSLPERFLSPKASAMADLWKPILCLHRLLELLPKLISTSWHNDKIENMLIVVLDHGNNQDVRVLGYYTLCLYIVASGGNCSQRAIDLFTNAISLRAFSYVDMPDASLVVGEIMCAIASGIAIPGIGCGQSAIIGFQPGRSSICPVLQDIVHPMNPQGILALRMLRDTLSFTMYLASLLPDPQAAYIEYVNLGLVRHLGGPFDFLTQKSLSTINLPPFAPLLALDHIDIQAALKALYGLFRKSYISWIYPYSEESGFSKNVRRVPVMGLRMTLSFMLECLVPHHSYMLSDREFKMPNLNGSVCAGVGSTASKHASEIESKIATGYATMATRAYDVLRHVMLDSDIKSAYFFIDILRLSLQELTLPQREESERIHTDQQDLSYTGYENCLAALTVIRLWMLSKEEYRPVHLLPDSQDGNRVLITVIKDYMEYIYRLLDWLIVILYNVLLVHRVVMRLYRQVLPLDVKVGFMETLQSAAIKFLAKPPKNPADASNTQSSASRALTMLSEADERILIQESMFSGKRQRKGMSIVDSYLKDLQNPSHHLNTEASQDILETATPFTITSNLSWSTMRTVFSSVHQSAVEDDMFQKAAYQYRSSEKDIRLQIKSDEKVAPMLKKARCVYAHVFLSSPKNLCQLSSALPGDLISKARENSAGPARVFRKIPQLLPSDKLVVASQPPALANRKSGSRQTSSEQPQHRLGHSKEKMSPGSTNIWHKIVSPFRRRRSHEHPQETTSSNQLHLDRSKKTYSSDSLHAQLQPHLDAQDYGKTPISHDQSMMNSPEESENRQENRDLVNGARKQSRSSSRYVTDSMSSMDMQYENTPTKAIGPASFEEVGFEKGVSRKHSQSGSKNLVRDSNIDAQKVEVANQNSNAAIDLVDNMLLRIWQSEAVWTDFHISEFVLEQQNQDSDLQKMWLDWVSMLGTPFNDDLVKSKIVLDGLVGSWDVYRAVLDCSRYTPDNDDVLLNTSWWISEMAVNLSIDDERGRIAQTAIFRMGCRCSDHINSRVLFLRSRFIQIALITLSPLVRGEDINIKQIQVYLIECQLLLSLGISGSRMLLLALERGLHRLLLEPDSYKGDFCEPAVQGAVIALVSLSTLLSGMRALNVNHRSKNIRKLVDSHLVDTDRDKAAFSKIVGTIEQQDYPIMHKVPGHYQFSVEWIQGGPIFGKSCDTMLSLLAEDSPLKRYGQKYQGAIEHMVLSGLAVVCYTELCLSDKRQVARHATYVAMSNLRNEMLISNCLAAISSRLFSTNPTTARVAITCLSLLDLGKDNSMSFLGVTRARRLAMTIMEATVEHFDRLYSKVSAETALLIRELLYAIKTTIIKFPELITHTDSFVEGADGTSIRDFLIDKIIYKCANSKLSESYTNHQFNRVLTTKKTPSGTVYDLKPSIYEAPPHNPLDSLGFLQEEDQLLAERISETLKQHGEILYVNMMLFFDENDRSKFYGEQPVENVFFYSHGNNIICLYNEPNSECTSLTRTHFGNEKSDPEPETLQQNNNSNYNWRQSKDYSKTPCPEIDTGRDFYADDNDDSSLTTISTLNTSTILAEQSKNVGLHGVKVFSPEEAEIINTSGLRLEDYKVIDSVNRFVASEAQACKFASIPLSSESDSSSPTLPAKSESRSSGHTESAESNNDPETINDPLNPLKMNMFRNLIQHRMACDAQKLNLNYFRPLVKSESLYRDLEALDRINPNVTIKIALLYIGPGQWTEAEILSNTLEDTSLAYQSFVSSLGWRVDLKTFRGYIGKLNQDGSDGTTCPYFSDQGLEVVFHEAVSMPTDKNDTRQLKKKRHVGNDHVHIIWNESHHNYRPETISGDFGNVQIQIRPLETGEYGIVVYSDEQISPFGPLINGMVVSADVLPAAVRATAINGHRRAVQVYYKAYVHPYATRQQSINRISEKHADRSSQAY
ncbi:hypothetical protein FB645_003665 [Coemansia sp. IMI 203386]|nr:hypothetical protein FB645_003665 [Coemansia sp. IMI 203386]